MFGLQLERHFFGGVFLFFLKFFLVYLVYCCNFTTVNEKQNKMNATTGEYKVKFLGGRYFVIYQYNDGDSDIMSDSYKTEAGANKMMKKIKTNAGVK